MRAEDLFYAGALAILMAWLVFSPGSGALHHVRTSLDSPAPRTGPRAVSAPGPPKVMAEVTLDSERFYILVGEGPPNFGVAVSVSDQPNLEPLGGRSTDQ